MATSSDTLHFSFPTYGDSILSKMNVLREEHQFCDITLHVGTPKDGLPVHFRGHRVVLAASSDFLRDQFLLHEGQAELSVGVVSSGRVAESLFLSCYTGLLEIPLRELVSYLTAASALQMSQVVEKCTEAVSLYISPTLTFLKQKLSRSWLDSSCDDQKEKDEVQSRNQEAKQKGVSLREGQQAGQKLRDSKEKITTTRSGGGSRGKKQLIGRTTSTKDPEKTLLQRPYLCRKCDKVFQHLESYMDHVKESKEYFCLVCKKSFSGRGNLSRHICTYTAAKPFRCPLCHKTFTKKALLQDHFHLHTRESPRKCALHLALT
uniref:Uncharacterized protein n=1 Tax=Oryzias sinensis TaxID=183150 RepID=A0A8C7Y768_9TELE